MADYILGTTPPFFVCILCNPLNKKMGWGDAEAEMHVIFACVIVIMVIMIMMSHAYQYHAEAAGCVLLITTSSTQLSSK